MWASDGTTSGTGMMKYVYTGSVSWAPFSMAALGDTLFFTECDEACGQELWKSDGTTTGTVMVTLVTPTMTMTVSWMMGMAAGVQMTTPVQVA